MEKGKSLLKRIFINNIDSYSSKYIAKFLSECVAGAHDEEEEESLFSNSKEKAFEIVGTVSEVSDEDRSHVLEQYDSDSSRKERLAELFHQTTRVDHSVTDRAFPKEKVGKGKIPRNKEELLPKLLACDVIVYNITEHQEQVDEALWALTMIHNAMDNFTGQKMFVLVSTVMTWACRKPIDPEDEERPFTDEDFRRRRPHPNFKAHNDLEKKVVKLGKTNKSMFSTCVLVSGMQYGMGEQIFHYFFKTSWEGLAPQIPIFGDGTNIVPTIHINDLAIVIQSVIEQRPRSYYLLAVDNSHNTLEEIVQAISKALGPGTTKKVPLTEAYLIRELTTMHVDYMTVNLRMESAHLAEQLSIPWQCEKGLVENMAQAVDEYRRNRGLQPLRICVMGPPAVGKSTVSKIICDLYKLHHVQLKPTITETIAQLTETVQQDSQVESEGAEESQELLINLTESMEQNKGLLDEQLLLKVVKDKLVTQPCLNQGFVLDGFPKTYNQAKDLYEVEDGEEEDDEMGSNKSLPELVFLLDGSDSQLKERVMNLPESEVVQHNYAPEHFLERLGRYRLRDSKDTTVADFYDQFNVTTVALDMANDNDPNCLSLLQKITETLGPPRNYGRSIDEVEEQERKELEEKRRKEAQRKAEEEEREAEEARDRAAHWEQWSRSLEELQQQEEVLLEAQTSQMRSYLMEHVMPTLSQGMLACCSAQPDDPLDFLAEYLIKNNPSNWTKL